MTFSFFRSDKLVYPNAWLRPISPCQPTQAMAGPIFSYLWNPHLNFPGRVHEFYGCLLQELGSPDVGFPDFGFWTRSDHKLINTVMSRSGAVPMATNSRHSHPGQTHSGCLNVIGLVDLLSRLKQPITTVKAPPRNSDPDLLDIGN